MADNSNDPVMQNQDVIQGARAIRSNPALFAALMSPPTPLRRRDPKPGWPRTTPRRPFGEPPRGSQRSAPQNARARSTSAMARLRGPYAAHPPD